LACSNRGEKPPVEDGKKGTGFNGPDEKELFERDTFKEETSERTRKDLVWEVTGGCVAKIIPQGVCVGSRLGGGGEKKFKDN